MNTEKKFQVELQINILLKKKGRFEMKRPPVLIKLPILKLLVQSCFAFFINLDQNNTVIF